MAKFAKFFSVILLGVVCFAYFFFAPKKANAWFGYGKTITAKVEHNSQLITVSCCKQSMAMSCRRGVGNDCEMGGIF
jgi:hypothetical protein